MVVRFKEIRYVCLFGFWVGFFQDVSMVSVIRMFAYGD